MVLSLGSGWGSGSSVCLRGLCLRVSTGWSTLSTSSCWVQQCDDIFSIVRTNLRAWINILGPGASDVSTERLKTGWIKSGNCGICRRLNCRSCSLISKDRCDYRNQYTVSTIKSFEKTIAVHVQHILPIAEEVYSLLTWRGTENSTFIQRHGVVRITGSTKWQVYNRTEMYEHFR